MADASRFPRLAPPFAIVGGAAGWLSGRLLAHPIVSRLADDLVPVTVIVATITAALAGMLMRSICIGRRYRYDLSAPDPDARPDTDVWWKHALVMLGVGAATGAMIGELHVSQWALGALDGMVCALVFLPVGFAVIHAGRKAQRARLGSIVAASDRRAVWSILATTLGIATIEAIPDGITYGGARAAIVMLAFAMAVVFGVVVADDRARRKMEISVRDLEEAPPLSREEIAEVDLGVGEDMGARIERVGAAYRQTERAIALVRGSPRLAASALKRAVMRGALSLAVLGCIGALHFAASSHFAHEAYVQWRTPDLVDVCRARCEEGELRYP